MKYIEITRHKTTPNALPQNVAILTPTFFITEFPGRIEPVLAPQMGHLLAPSSIVCLQLLHTMGFSS
jgi:hypothetical protein